MKYAGETLSFEVETEVLDVRLHREPCNEIGLATLADLETVQVALGAPGVRAMIVRSSLARGFCAGADLKELHRESEARRRIGVMADRRAIEVRRFLDRIHAVFDAIDAAPITTIAAVHGVVFGGGFELALACDIIVADKTARFCFPELRLGLIPGFGGIPRLRRDVGNAIVRDLLLTGRSIGAARAHEIGLVSQVAAEGEAVGIARRVAAQARRFDWRAAAAGKSFAKPIPKAELEREKDIFCDLFTSPEVEKALARFAKDESAMPYLPPSADAPEEE